MPEIRFTCEVHGLPLPHSFEEARAIVVPLFARGVIISITGLELDSYQLMGGVQATITGFAHVVARHQADPEGE